MAVYDVVVVYSEVCFEVEAENSAEAVRRGREMADFSPEREPFIAHVETVQMDPHVYVAGQMWQPHRDDSGKGDLKDACVHRDEGGYCYGRPDDPIHTSHRDGGGADQHVEGGPR
jgi:hypothetical protein